MSQVLTTDNQFAPTMDADGFCLTEREYETSS